ncbi:tyrosine-type recombinase/integrase [Marivita sp.]|uniref:tyrosine-type recombinase/integrase n=1 Tax=Marivita sp. TaxID=2003365 RepID=UPI003A83B72E
MSIAKRGRLYHLRRRVPHRYRGIEPRETVWISLHTDPEMIARSKADRAWSQMIEAWEARLAGNSADAEARYEAARDLARARGFRYLDAGSVGKLPVEDVVERGEAIPAPANQPDPVEAAALLGTVPETRITVTKALQHYWTLAREKTFGKSEDQLRRWEAPRKKAIRNFVAVVGDKEIANITRDDMLDFRQQWLDRIEAGEVTANSANKDLIHLGDLLKTVNTMKRLGLSLPLGELSFKEGEARTRPPFSEDWIKTRLLAPGALEGLNDEARCLLLGMVNTGYRPSEGTALTADTIRLNHNVPHISIEPIGRQLKSQYARRVIPLTGVSLEAFKEFPEGFPRYRDSATFSAIVNKFLRGKGMLETPRHSFYSLRHSFEDRMLAAGIDDRIRRDLFGHRLDRERYGKGASLEHVAELVARIAF